MLNEVSIRQLLLSVGHFVKLEDLIPRINEGLLLQAMSIIIIININIFLNLLNLNPLSFNLLLMDNFHNLDFFIVDILSYNCIDDFNPLIDDWH